MFRALAIFLVMTGGEVMFCDGAPAWLADVLGAPGAALATVLVVALPVANLVLSFYAARRIWPDVGSEEPDEQPTRRHLVGQHQL
jgi:hypothetical protein